tara:strand:- start:243 stop:371 length:129 start_codon:yes stop_codon:yes gene_type:complete
MAEIPAKVKAKYANSGLFVMDGVSLSHKVQRFNAAVLVLNME